MKAMQFAQPGGPEVLEMRELADPTPEGNEVLVAVQTTSVNRLDLFQRDGKRPVDHLPFTPGLEAAGVVIGSGNGFEEGDRVMTTRAMAAKGGGGYANLIAVPADFLVRIPDNVGFEEAAAAGLASSTAWTGLYDIGQLKAGEQVLIWSGSSGVGSLAIQLAKNTGCWVATTASSEERAEQLRQLGADLVINHKTQEVGKTVQEAGGVDLVLETVGNTLQESINACRSQGRVVLIGNLGGAESTVNTQSWRLKSVQVLGGGMMHTTPQNEEKILKLISEDKIKPLIARIMPIAEVAEAHRLLEQGHLQGKIVLQHNEV